MKRKIRTYSGTKSREESPRELRNRRIAREAAGAGMVLLKNEGGLLPLKKGQKLALLGGGAVRTVKGGTGSGDVNERECVNILQGLQNAGFEITTGQWLADYEKVYESARLDWKNQILREAQGLPMTEFFHVYSRHPFSVPPGRVLSEADVDKGTDTAVFVVSRVSGEGADRRVAPGDYCLAPEEEENLKAVCTSFAHVVLILNTGSVMDLSFADKYKNIQSIVYMSQAGMEGGNALADILSGDAVPSGKLTDTWAKRYEDYPASAEFSLNDGRVDKEYYKEGIYVGYRYFDSFSVKPLYAFGFGLSYTEFEITPREQVLEAHEEEQRICVSLRVENTGSRYPGREVVQVYVSCPQDGLDKERRRLCGFAKTELIKPGQAQDVEISFPVKAMASFDQENHAWVTQAGLYGVWAGNSSDSLSLLGAVRVEETAVIERTEPVCPLREPLAEISRPGDEALFFEQTWHREREERKLPEVSVRALPEKLPVYQETEGERMAAELAEKLPVELMIPMVAGEIGKGQSAENALGSAGIMVPGAAGETSSALLESYGIPGLPMADGPAGLRLTRSYQVSKENGVIMPAGVFDAFEGGLFSEPVVHENADTYYQYCTAIPVGTLLAQSWDTALVARVGKMVGEEMGELGVVWWLAPGMNIHRDPLCGRNFEYYSEDPLLSGAMAAAVTMGVQSCPGVGATVKHFACNNQEENRMGTDSIVSERALREIYLRGFEIAVKTSQPMAVMTSYNMVNGVHSANSYDLCTRILRQEWGFRGVVMTDWTTTSPGGGSTPYQCAAAGNDLIMPGVQSDLDNIREALERGDLSEKALRDCVRRIISMAYQSDCFEDAAPAADLFNRIMG